MFSIKVTRSPNYWNSGIKKWVNKIDNAIDVDLNERQLEIEAFMKENAPWEDVTGQARASLSVDMQRNVGEWVLLFGYSRRIFESYGRYLEYDHAGKFSILYPTMDNYFPIILDDMKAIVE